MKETPWLEHSQIIYPDARKENTFRLFCNGSIIEDITYQQLKQIRHLADCWLKQVNQKKGGSHE